MANVNYLYLVVGQKATNLSCISLYVNTKYIVACMHVVNNTIIWLRIPGFFESLLYPSCSFKYQTIMTAFSVAVVECIDSPAWLWSVFLFSLGWPVLALTAYTIMDSLGHFESSVYT